MTEMNRYLMHNEIYEGVSKMHLLSILNSSLLAIVLFGFISVISFKDIGTDKKDLEVGQEKPVSIEENGWKLVRSEAFQVPETKNLLCAFFGTGIQIFLIVSALLSIFHCFLVQIVILIVLGSTGYYSQTQGTFYSIIIGVYALTSFVSGYSSARLYRHIGGTHWGFNILTTGWIFPLPLFGCWLIINNVAWVEGSTIALKFSTIFIVMSIWLLITIPLTIFGGITAKIKSSDEVLESEHKAPKIPKVIPDVVFYKHPLFSMLISGLVPFVASYIEVSYILNSVWGHKIYNLYGVLIISFLLLVASSCNF